MKCIKNVKTGNIVRIDDRQANNMVGSMWSYVPKSEWKKQNGKSLEDVTEETSVGVTLKEKKKKTSKKVK